MNMIKIKVGDRVKTKTDDNIGTIIFIEHDSNNEIKLLHIDWEGPEGRRGYGFAGSKIMVKQLVLVIEV